MRIGLLTSSYPRHERDTAGRFVAELCRWLAQRGDRVEVLAPAPARGADPQVAVTALRYALRPRLFFGAGAPDNLLGGGQRRDLLAPQRLRAWAQAPGFVAVAAATARWASRRWDAVISHWLLPCGLVGSAATRGLPHLAIAHSSDVHLLGRLPGAAPLLHLIARPRSGLSLTSEGLRPTLRAVARTRRARDWVASAAVNRMGISPPPAIAPGAPARLRARHRLGGANVALFIGRLVPVKGADQLLRACAGLPRTAVVLLGDGPQRAALEALAARVGCRALFRGEQVGEEKAAWLAAADVLVAPSAVLPDGRGDSAPVVLLEGMSAALPVISTAVGGAAELISDGEDGLLVPPGDVPALRAAITRLADAPALRATLGARAARTAERHTWDCVGEKLRAQLAAL